MLTPLFVFVGFLGAGKTTLLRVLIPQLQALGCVPSVILNDYQNARVDAEFFREMKAAVTPISGSCVCCGSRQDLLDALDAYEAKDGGVLLLETNGTTDAEELMTVLAADPKLRKFTLPAQVSIIDMKRWQKRFWHNALESHQVKTTSYLVFGHLDEVDDVRQAQVEDSLHRMGIHQVATTATSLALEIATLVQSVREQTERSFHSKGCSCGHHHHHHSSVHEPREYHFSAIEVILPSLVQRAVFLEKLKHLPKEILRAKGLVRFQEEPDKLQIFQKIEHFDTVQIVPIEGEPLITQPLAVFIGSAIPHKFSTEFLLDF